MVGISPTVGHGGLHPFCFLTNPSHLLFTPRGEGGCPFLWRVLGRSCGSFSNRRYIRTGALWEHPFRSSLVDSAMYVLACYRYIERNPVRACMVVAPDAHPWSSYAGNMALRRDALLTPHAEYLALGHDETSRLRAYAGLLTDADEPGFLKTVREATDAGYPLVANRLKCELEKAGARLEPGRPGPRALWAD